ncbi:cell number regulator 8-like [Punica granatum]|uniref:Cell number regulator 8-like n=2 Tax=Punica granatum TaxID=22663 RepID=A0A6P8CD37_PUNGR|nr:cell number regulator 8-like [Punica granatum]PKI68166.1 hypothetical protein CRG98_011465 [Punica granatum]
MADASDAPHHDESSPLLGEKEAQVGNGKEEDAKAGATSAKIQPSKPAPVEGTPAPESASIGYVWAADGLPVGEPVGRAQWDSSLFACLGRNDEFCSSDLEVCLLGSVAPCMLYGSNAERLGSSPGTFATHCLAYCGLYLFGSSFLGWNLAPYFSYATRTAIRRRFNLEGSFEALHRSCGCRASIVEDEVQLEHCEAGCDLLTHVCCHACALCQEGREVRRRLPHPGFNAQPILVMVPPVEQSMAREA